MEVIIPHSNKSKGRMSFRQDAVKGLVSLPCDPSGSAPSLCWSRGQDGCSRFLGAREMRRHLPRVFNRFSHISHWLELGHTSSSKAVAARGMKLLWQARQGAGKLLSESNPACSLCLNDAWPKKRFFTFVKGFKKQNQKPKADVCVAEPLKYLLPSSYNKTLLNSLKRI